MLQIGCAEIVFTENTQTNNLFSVCLTEQMGWWGSYFKGEILALASAPGGVPGMVGPDRAGEAARWSIWAQIPSGDLGTTESYQDSSLSYVSWVW